MTALAAVSSSKATGSSVVASKSWTPSPSPGRLAARRAPSGLAAKDTTDPPASRTATSDGVLVSAAPRLSQASGELSACSAETASSNAVATSSCTNDAALARLASAKSAAASARSRSRPARSALRTATTPATRASTSSTPHAGQGAAQPAVDPAFAGDPGLGCALLGLRQGDGGGEERGLGVVQVRRWRGLATPGCG